MKNRNICVNLCSDLCLSVVPSFPFLTPMPKITFQPSSKTVEAPIGTPLHEVARAIGIDIHAPCGGTGTCGKCLVRVISGEVHHGSLGILSREQIEQGIILACTATVGNGDVVIDLSMQTGSAGKFSDSSDQLLLVDPVLLPSKQDLSAVVRTVEVTVDSPQLADGLSDVDRLTRALRAGGGEAPEISLGALRQLADAVREDSGRVSVVLCEEEDRARIISVLPQSRRKAPIGIAVDVGTTTVAVQEVDLESGTILSTHTDYNGQIPCGLDVISRINYARTPQRLDELRCKVVATINSLIEKSCVQDGLVREEIVCVWVSGNTTMQHLLLGLPPEHIRLDPYTPTLLRYPSFSATQVDFSINPDARVFFSP